MTRIRQTLLGVAAVLLVAGLFVPHALLVAAGLILAGSIGLGGSRSSASANGGDHDHTRRTS